MTGNTEAKIRPLEAGDFDAWLQLWLGYQRFYKVDLPDATTQVTFERLLDPGEPMWAALATTGGSAVGLAHVIEHRSTWTPGNYAYLQDLFVADAVRGQGIGRMLIDYVYARAKADGCSRVHWLTHETNTDAMQLYDRIGDRSGFVQYRKIF